MQGSLRNLMYQAAKKRFPKLGPRPQYNSGWLYPPATVYAGEIIRSYKSIDTALCTNLVGSTSSLVKPAEEVIVGSLNGYGEIFMGLTCCMINHGTDVILPFYLVEPIAVYNINRVTIGSHDFITDQRYLKIDGFDRRVVSTLYDIILSEGDSVS